GLRGRQRRPRGARRAVHRRALRDRPREGRHRLPQLDQRRPRGDLRGRPLGRGGGEDRGHGAPDARAAGGRPVLTRSRGAGHAPAPRGTPRGTNTGGPLLRQRADPLVGLPGDAPAHRGVRLARSRARARARGAAGRPPAPAACGVDALRRAHAQHAAHARVLRDGARRTPVRHHPAARLLDRGAVPDALHLGVRLRGAALGHQLGRRGSGRSGARDRADLRAVAAARDPPPGGPHRDPAPDQRHHRAREEHLGRGRFRGGRARRDGPTPRAGHPGRGRDDPRWDRAAVPRVHDPGRSARDPPREEGGVRTMSSVLYDAPGPVARRRELWGSIAGSVLILVGMFFAVRYAAGRGVFQLDRWDVLWDPPKNQSAATVWRSLIVQGLGATLRAAALAAPLALGLGLLLALWRRVPNVWLRAPAIAVVEVARGLPVLLVMLFGWLGFNMQPFAAVVFGLTLYNMAIFAEILRAGLAALPRGQAEASLAIGMTRWQTLVLVELPQAVRTMT